MEDQSAYVEIKHKGKQLKMLLLPVCQKQLKNVAGVADASAYGVARP